jgi:hypothetical protein
MKVYYLRVHLLRYAHFDSFDKCYSDGSCNLRDPGLETHSLDENFARADDHRRKRGERVANGCHNGCLIQSLRNLPSSSLQLIIHLTRRIRFFLFFLFAIRWICIYLPVFKVRLNVGYIQRLGIRSQLLELIFPITNLSHQCRNFLQNQ